MTPFVTFGLNGFALELKGINNFIKTKLNRVVYRAMMVRAFNQHRGLRRRLINQREYNLLDFLLMETEPVDPFSDNPSREISHSELQRAPFIKASYSGVTRRTFIRELTRLAENGFIILTQDVKTKDFIVNLNFMAIGRY